MNTFVVEEQAVVVPEWVRSHKSFRKWMRSEDFPEEGRICYLDGEVWVDMSREQFFSHHQVKNEFAFVLTGLAKVSLLGRYVPDGMLLTCPKVGLTAQLDGAFILYQSLSFGRVQLLGGAHEGFLELEGTPDRVLFEIDQHTPNGYVAVRKQAGWTRSRVFKKSLRLTRRTDQLHNPDFTLAVR